MCEGEQGARGAIIYGGDGGQAAHHFLDGRRYLWEISGTLWDWTGSFHPRAAEIT